ncbi:Putative phospholipase A1 precursor [Kingella potus]|uniref:Phospholipase A1 n=1 Tax=Kingella potus TaxID=265175 RepID=A0A377R1N6_9NEIS|nr:phospholipase A [Kingella potus]STR02657.1 Putative phospholipase A1 precursor [Kingella potus]
MNKTLYLSALVSVLILPAAHAADDAALQCALLQENALRLACYDKIFAAQFPPVQKVGMPQPAAKPQPDIVGSVRESIQLREPVLVEHKDGVVSPTEELAEAAAAYTPLSRMYDLDANRPGGILTVREHQPMYLMPAWYNSSPNRTPSSPTRGTTTQERFTDQQRTETKMQVSFKSKVAEDLFKSRADLWFGYTQKSDWQIYNQGNRSAPFRNTDYEPEIFITQPVRSHLPFGGRLRMIGAGFAHQSNGQSRPESRSWNKIYAMAGMEWGRLTVIPRVWTRVFDEKGDKNDNPDLADYIGYGDLKLHYRLTDKQNLSATLRYNPRTGYGAAEAAYTFPIKGKLQGIVRGFHGYGDSLIDYNHKQNGIGFGLMFQGWDGL